jgi:hypothetical protein
LGLAIAEHIVELHGGTIEVMTKMGEGTTFKISVPRNGQDRQGDASRHGETSSADNDGHLTAASYPASLMASVASGVAD